MNDRGPVLIAGGGPAGTGVLLAALKYGRMDALLARGVCVVERSPSLGRGSLGAYAIDSDTLADVLVECLEGPARDVLAPVFASPAYETVRSHLGGPLPLACVAGFLAVVGDTLHAWLAAQAGARVITGADVLGARRRASGFDVAVRHHDGTRETLHAGSLVSALGGVQDREHVLDTTLATGVCLGDPRWSARVMGSAQLLTIDGLARADARIAEGGRAVVVGSSHSAVSSVRVLLERARTESVTLLVRRPLRLFYPSREDALRDGYRAWTDRDVCPTTGRVHRLGGLRLQARQCAREILGLGDTTIERRVQIADLAAMPRDALTACLDQASLVVAATGYRPRTVPLTGAHGERIALRGHTGTGALVDAHCRVIDARGDAVPDVYAIGLASGFVPWGAMGGEPGFTGQTNGLWLYQHHVGALALDGVLGPHA